MARIDFVVASVFGLLSALLLYFSYQAGAEATRTYGRNVDSGVYEYLAAVLYLAPVAVLFVFAAVSLWREWRIRWYAHWLAVASIVLLPAAVSLMGW